MCKKRLIIGFIFILLLGSALFAQRKVIDRQQENLQYKSLQIAGKTWDKKIQEVYKKLEHFGFLVALAKDDRKKAILGEKEPLDFRHDRRHLKFVPWRNSIRYVKEGEDFLLNSFGDIEEVKALIAKKIQLAAQNNMTVPKPNIGNREGFELSQFGFIYVKDPDKTRAIGTQRRRLTLYFSGPNQQLAAATMRIEYHNFREDVKEIELIIDPTPIDKQMEDIVILHRHNKKEAKVDLLALMHNSKAFANRNKFKSKYHNYLRVHFFQSIQRIATYNVLNPQKFNQKAFERRLERGLAY